MNSVPHLTVYFYTEVNMYRAQHQRTRENTHLSVFEYADNLVLMGLVAVLVFYGLIVGWFVNGPECTLAIFTGMHF